MNVLLTGAGGFVGRAVWQAVRENGWSVQALGRRSSDQPGYREHDLRFPLPTDLPTPDVIVHMAARSSPWGNHADFAADNIIATQNVLSFAAQRGFPHIVHISTAAVLYTAVDQLEMDESTPFGGPAVNAYAATKQAAEQLVTAYPGDAVILRPRAIFGPGDTVLFPRILRAAEAKRLPRILSERPVMCSLIYIETLTAYILAAIRQRSLGCYHLSNSENIELWPFLDEVFTALNLPRPTKKWSVRRAFAIATCLEQVHRLCPRLGEPPLTRFGVGVFAYSKTLDTRKAQRDLGPPAISLTDGVQRFIQWQRQQHR